MKLKQILLVFLLFFAVSIDSHKILVFSIPKCGTHLVIKAVELLTNKKLENEFRAERVINYGIPEFKTEKTFFRCHMPYMKSVADELVKKKIKTFFIYRDPRDHVVSRAYWIQGRMQGKKESIENLINFLISQIDTYYDHFMPWKKDHNVCTLKFENLVGKLGGGDDALQRAEIKKICNYLKINSDVLVNYCIKNLYGGTFTFREGQIGSWKKHFSATQKRNFKEKGGQLLIRLGYENDLNW